MAEVVAIKIEVDGGKSVSELKKINSEVDELTESVHYLENAEHTQAKAFQKGARESQKEIDLINEKQLQLGISSRNVSSGMINGYTAFLGVSSLVGTDQEALIKTFIRLQSVQKTLNATTKLSNDLKKGSKFRQDLTNTSTKIGSVLNKAYAFSLKGINIALKTMKGALIATGLGALVVLIGTIIAKWDDWKDSIMKIINVAFFPLMATLRLLGVIESDLEKERNINSEKQVKRLQRESDLLDEVTEIQNKRLRNEIDVSKARGDNTRQLEEKMIRSEGKGALQRLKIAKDLYDAKLRLDGDLSKEELEKLEDKIDEEQEAFEESLQNLKVFKAQEFKIKKDADDKADAEAKAKGVKAQQKREQEKEKERQLQEQIDAKDLELIREFEDLKLEQIVDADKRAVKQLELQQERELEDFKASKLFTAELEKEIEKNNALELANLKEEQRLAQKEKDDAQKLEDDANEKANREEINGILAQHNLDSIENTFERARKELEIQRDAELKRLELIEASEDEINKVKGIYSEKSKELKKSEADYEDQLKKEQIAGALKVASQGFKLIGSLAKKNSALAKASAIADTVINTYKGAMSSYANTPGGPILKGIAASIAVATGLATIKKIVSTPIPGGGGGGSGVTPPSFSTQSEDTSTINSQSTNENGIGSNNIPTSRVVLVESDLRLMQERRNNSEIISTI